MTLTTDYDEGAADALMTLHGDRPPSVAPRAEDSPPAMTGSKRPASPTSPGNNKKARPEAVTRLSAPTAPGRNGSASPAKRQVIEVLNTPSISSPIPRPTSTLGEKDTPAPAPEEKQAGAEGTPATESAQPGQVDEVDGAEPKLQPEAAASLNEAADRRTEGDVEMKDDQAPAALPTSADGVAKAPVKDDDQAPAEDNSDAAPAAEVLGSGAEKPEEKAAEAEETSAAPSAAAAEAEAVSASEPTAQEDAPKSDNDVAMEEDPVAPVSELKEAEAAAEKEAKVAESAREAVAGLTGDSETAETSKPEEKSAEKEEGEV